MDPKSALRELERVTARITELRMQLVREQRRRDELRSYLHQAMGGAEAAASPQRDLPTLELSRGDDSPAIRTTAEYVQRAGHPVDATELKDALKISYAAA